MRKQKLERACEKTRALAKRAVRSSAESRWRLLGDLKRVRVSGSVSGPVAESATRAVFNLSLQGRTTAGAERMEWLT